MLERQHALEAAIVRYAKHHRGELVVADLVCLLDETQQGEEASSLLRRCIQALVDRGYLESLDDALATVVYVP
jgi:hypothetical protein